MNKVMLINGMLGALGFGGIEGMMQNFVVNYERNEAYEEYERQVVKLHREQIKRFNKRKKQKRAYCK